MQTVRNSNNERAHDYTMILLENSIENLIAQPLDRTKRNGQILDTCAEYTEIMLLCAQVSMCI